jgi:signal peptidase I
MSADAERKQGGVERAVRFWLPVLLLVVVVRTFLFQPFHIPSESMKPTLLVGDSLFVTKFSYGYSRYSIPFSPDLFSGRILASSPKRGDVAVFRHPRDPSADLIKRVIGLPGDRIQMIGGHLHLNGEPVKREQVQDFIDTEEVPGRVFRFRQWRETLPDGRSFTTLDFLDNGPTAGCSTKSGMSRLPTLSAVPRSSTSRSATVPPPGRSGAGHRRCV